MLTPSQTRKIKFTLGRGQDGDFVSHCNECGATVVTMYRSGIAAHNRSKAAHRDKHRWGQIPSPTFDQEA